MATEKQVTLRLAIPEELADKYEAAAVLQGKELEAFLTAHLERTIAWADDKAPIYLNDRQAGELRSLLGGRANDPEKLIAITRKLCSWRVGGYKIELPPATIEQIFWYARSAAQPIELVAPQLILDALREKLGVG